MLYNFVFFFNVTGIDGEFGRQSNRTQKTVTFFLQLP